MLVKIVWKKKTIYYIDHILRHLLFYIPSTCFICNTVLIKRSWKSKLTFELVLKNGGWIETILFLQAYI